MPWSEWARLRGDWTELWQRAAQPTIFMSPQWMETWLEVFGPRLRPTLFQVRDAAGAVTCFALVCTEERHRGLPVRRLYLNAAGEGQAHDTCVEYNDLLCRPGCEAVAAASVASQMAGFKWDEFMLSGVVPSGAIHALFEHRAPASDRTVTKPAHYVDLADLRVRSAPYESTLSANTRAQVRRSRSLYESSGPIVTELASDLPTAMQFLGELVEMHQRRWTSLGEPGAFNSTAFSEFHQRLIQRLWHDGSAHLVRVRAGDSTIGILYNFVVNGRVAFYQSGFSYASDNRFKPGLVTHAAAIEHYLKDGYIEYDFLAGSSRYKQSLAKHARELQWTVHERRGMKMAMYRWVRILKRKAVDVRRKRHQSAALPTPPSPANAERRVQ